MLPPLVNAIRAYFTTAGLGLLKSGDMSRSVNFEIFGPSILSEGGKQLRFPIEGGRVVLKSDEDGDFLERYSLYPGQGEVMVAQARLDQHSDDCEVVVSRNGLSGREGERSAFLTHAIYGPSGDLEIVSIVLGDEVITYLPQDQFGPVVQYQRQDFFNPKDLVEQEMILTSVVQEGRSVKQAFMMETQGGILRAGLEFISPSSTAADRHQPMTAGTIHRALVFREPWWVASLELRGKKGPWRLAQPLPATAHFLSTQAEKAAFLTFCTW